MTDPVPSKELLSLIQHLIYCVNGCEFNGMPNTADACRKAIAEIERLQRLLDARPPYYCKNCDCANCGNTRPAAEPSLSRDLIDYGYAPGQYAGACMDCKQHMDFVDKRCHVCRPCAEKRRDRAAQPPGDG